MELQIIDIASLTATATISIYHTPPGTKALYVRLWGAGGGGAGTGSTNRVSCQIGGGGGGGGWVEGWFKNNLSTNYEYFVAFGANGGTNFAGGATAEASWFSDPAHLYALGGGGGSSVTFTIRAIGTISATGGFGGTAGGSNALSSGCGQQGGDGFINGANLGRLNMAGCGGSCSRMSGQT